MFVSFFSGSNITSHIRDWAAWGWGRYFHCFVTCKIRTRRKWTIVVKIHVRFLDPAPSPPPLPLLTHYAHQAAAPATLGNSQMRAIMLMRYHTVSICLLRVQGQSKLPSSWAIEPAWAQFYLSSLNISLRGDISDMHYRSGSYSLCSLLDGDDDVVGDECGA